MAAEAGLEKARIKMTKEESGDSLDFSFSAETKVLVVRQPELSALNECTSTLS